MLIVACQQKVILPQKKLDKRYEATYNDGIATKKVNAQKRGDDMSEKEKEILEVVRKTVPRMSEKKKEKLLNVMDGIALMCDFESDQLKKEEK